nr:mediator of RNA polymerase II transcription subunit 33A isoform X2 [Arachis hypogaea]
MHNKNTHTQTKRSSHNLTRSLSIARSAFYFVFFFFSSLLSVFQFLVVSFHFSRMAVPAQTSATDQPSLWDAVLRHTELAQQRNSDPNLWASELAAMLRSSTVILPSVELAHHLVSHFFWKNHCPTAWKFLERAISLNIVPPLLLLALLSATIMTSIDEVLLLSQVYNRKDCEPGVVLVEFVFSIVWQLLEALLDDEGLLDHASEDNPRWLRRSDDMNIGSPDCFAGKKTEQRGELQRENTAMAIEIVAEFLQNKITSRILSLVHQNMPSHWGFFIRQMHLLVSNSSVLRSSKHITPEALLLLMENIYKGISHQSKTTSKANVFMVAGSQICFAGQSFGDSCSLQWLPIDLILEDALGGANVSALSAIKIVTGLVKVLHAVNGSTWHSAFLGLWIAALRLVQRERDSTEGPVPRLHTCMCMLLSIITLVVAHIIDEEESLIEEAECSPANQRKDKPTLGKCRGELIASLQLLGDYEFLLTPPQSFLSEANKAAAKAIMFLAGNSVGSEVLESISVNDLPTKCSGNLWHLIVEACIARNLLDTSAYSWPGYVNACSNQIPCSTSSQVAGWSSLMKGSQLTPELVDVLVVTPASSLAEIEKIYEIATNGSDEEKISAATILCGASLVRGWNVQEHTILFMTSLLSPLVPPTESHLISQAQFLNVLLIGISSLDCVHIFSLHGLVPLLAAGLMRICEVFGSCVPDVSQTLSTGEELSFHEVFSNAFTLLLRFWRFDVPSIEHVRRDSATPPLGSLFCPDSLLLVRNFLLASFGRSAKDQITRKRFSKYITFPTEPVFLDSFPKFNFWYQQHQECIVSIPSGLVPGGPVHQIVDVLLCTLFRKINSCDEPLACSNSGSSGSPGSALNEAIMKLKVPAWDILEAIPFVLDAALTACAHGRLSTRQLATGLKDLADFLPASLVTIASYLSAEVRRGIWKPGFMNGTDWPSPAANLSLVEQQIKKILATTGVDVPSLAVDGDFQATLPLPLAAFVSLTLTYKLDKDTGRFLSLIGPVMIALASSCPWPCMPIVASLWVQKVKRWSDYLVLSASRTVFHCNKDAVVQLLRSCFKSTLGLGSACLHNNGGVGALLGHGYGVGVNSKTSDGVSPIAPGTICLKVYQYIGDTRYLSEEIVSILMQTVRDIVSNQLLKGDGKKQKKIKYGTTYGQVSLARSKARVKHAALLAASLVWISGGIKLVQYFIKETIPKWFFSSSMLELDGEESSALVAMLRGYALALFVMLSGAFAWGIDHSLLSRQRGKVMGLHFEFIASVLQKNIPLRCQDATWRAYVSGFLSLIVSCTPLWVSEINVDILKRLSKGLIQMNEHELALRLLEKGGIGAMGAAAEMIVAFQHRF